MHHNQMTRRGLIGSLAAGVAVTSATRSAAQTSWPSRPVRVIVGWPAGGSTDVLTRIFVEKLKDKIGGSWVVENRPGAGGNIGVEAVVRSEPDGYTLGTATVGAFSINQYLYSKMSWSSDQDIGPVSLAWEVPNVAVVSAKHVKATTLSEFIAWAKARPDGIFYASPGVGSTPHLSGALFAARHGIKATHVPFRGAASIIPAMLGGEVHFAIDNLPSYMAMLESGDMRPLAVSSRERWPSLPSTPTMAEAGTADFVVTSWSGFIAPRKLDPAITTRTADAIRVISADPAVKEQLAKLGATPLSSTPDGLTARAVAERPMWQEMIKISGARLD